MFPPMPRRIGVAQYRQTSFFEAPVGLLNVCKYWILLVNVEVKDCNIVSAASSWNADYPLRRYTRDSTPGGSTGTL